MFLKELVEQAKVVLGLVGRVPDCSADDRAKGGVRKKDGGHKTGASATKELVSSNSVLSG